MIGFSLIVEGFGVHIPKGYLYAAIGFSILIEAANQVGRRNVRKRVTTADLRDRTSRAVLRILRGGKAEPETGEEIAAIASAGGAQAVFSPAESSMIERVLTLGERSVRSIMVPRIDAVWLDVEDDPDTILDEIRKSGRSRFPVCRDEVDAVLGVVHAKDLLDQQRRDGRIDLASAVREPLYVTENMPALKVLERFRTSAAHMAIVLDEHGSFEGLVTPTDVLTAIVGELPELVGQTKRDAVEGPDGAWLLDGRMPIDEVERTLGITGMADDAYATLAGFVLDRLGRIPQIGELFDWQGWRFRVVEFDGHRIDKVSAIRTEVAVLEPDEM
jgi:CBS domain containing-hemolysin-like protein